MVIERAILTEIPKKNSGRPTGSYSELGAAIRRLNVGEMVEVPCLTTKSRNNLYSMFYQIGMKLRTKYTSRYFREKQTISIYRTL